MISGNSFFTVTRSVYDHHIFDGDEFSRRDAWLWLISKAAFVERRQTIRNKVVSIARGEAIHSIRELAKTWRWGEKKVRNFPELCSKRTKFPAAFTAQFAKICPWQKHTQSHF